MKRKVVLFSKFKENQSEAVVIALRTRPMYESC